MFGDVLGTVRNADQAHFSSIESHLMHTARMGGSAIFSPNQATDSAAAHAAKDARQKTRLMGLTLFTAAGKDATP